MKIVDIADEIFRELDQPTEISIPQIAFWIRVNVGTLNTLIYTEFKIDDTTLEISPDPKLEEKSVLKKLYIIHYYDLKTRASLGAAAQDSVIEVTSDGSTVRKLNKNQTSQMFISLKKQEMGELNRLIGSYKSLYSDPIQVAGDDTKAAFGAAADINRINNS